MTPVLDKAKGVGPVDFSLTTPQRLAVGTVIKYIHSTGSWLAPAEGPGPSDLSNLHDRQVDRTFPDETRGYLALDVPGPKFRIDRIMRTHPKWVFLD